MPDTSTFGPPMPGILLATGYTCLLLLLMRQWRFFNAIPGLPWHHLGIIFVLKILAGTALWWVYSHIYTDRLTADIFKYFDDSAVMFSALPGKPMDFLRMLSGIGSDTPDLSGTYYMKMNNWYRQFESNVYNDAHTVIRFNAFVRLFSFGEFHVHTVMSAFLSLTGMAGIYRTFVHMLPGRERALTIAVFLLPSVLFWASGVIKESLLFFGLGIMLYQVIRLREGRTSPGGIIALLAGMLLLLHLKFYVLMSMFPALVLYMITKDRPMRVLTLWTLLIFGLAIVLVLNVHLIAPGYDVLGLLVVKQKDFIGLAQGTGSGSFVMPPRLAADPWSFLVNAPYAIYITLLGPMIHFSGALGTISAVENFLVVAATVTVFLFARPWRTVDRPLVLSLSSYVLLLALVIGWTTPVMGAIVRYRTPLLPFLLIIALLMFDHRRFIARWPASEKAISA